MKGFNEVSLKPLLQAKQPQRSQPLLIEEVFQSSDHSCGPPLDTLQEFQEASPVLRTHGLDVLLKLEFHRSRVETCLLPLNCWSHSFLYIPGVTKVLLCFYAFAIQIEKSFDLVIDSVGITISIFFLILFYIISLKWVTEFVLEILIQLHRIVISFFFTKEEQKSECRGWIYPSQWYKTENTFSIDSSGLNPQ